MSESDPSLITGLLAEASKELTTLDSVLDNDVEGDMVRSPGNYSRHLRRVRQGLDLIRVLFEQFLNWVDVVIFRELLILSSAPCFLGSFSLFQAYYYAAAASMHESYKAIEIG